MKLTNIYNKGRIIYLFIRDEERHLKLRKVLDFHPYFYEPDEEGSYTGYDGRKLKKVIVTEPVDIPKLRSNDSFEADIPHTQRYIVDRLSSIDKTEIKYSFLDCETLSSKTEFPNPEEAKFPVTSISFSNSFCNGIRNFFITDFGTDIKKAEVDMFRAFIEYLKNEKFDLLLAWNMEGFDYPYLYNRFARLPETAFFQRASKYNNFAKAISPIGMVRGSRNRDLFLPAGASVVDYLSMFKKVNRSEKSYALNYIMEKYLGAEKEHKNVDFSQISNIIKERNIGDVQGLIDIESKSKLLPYYDEIRRFAKVTWEDLCWNSKIIESFLLQEAKHQNIALPTKKSKEEKEEEINPDELFEGAFREAFETGRFTNIGKYDLSGAYLYSIIDLCLDTSNIVDKKEENTIEVKVTDRKTETLTKQYFIKQNAKALLPKIVKTLVEEKNKLKKLKEETDVNDSNYEDLCKKYDAYKGVVLSSWGVIGFRGFRLFDNRIASMITSVVRDLIHYVRSEVEKKGYKVIYVDTDSVFCDDKGNNIVVLLNEIVQQWAKDRFNKNVSIAFDYEGHFARLLLIAKCRYFGYVDKGNGKVKEEIKGVEIKRQDSSKYMAKFQRILIDKILDNEPKESIIAWIKQEKENIKTQPLEDVAFPCKQSKQTDTYKSIPIFIRALEYSKDKFSMKKNFGELYYYIYVNPIDYEVSNREDCYTTTKPKKKLTIKELSKIDNLEQAIAEKKVEKRIKEMKKERDVIGFDEMTKKYITVDWVNWDKMIERNINNKTEVIFKALNWLEII